MTAMEFTHKYGLALEPHLTCNLEADVANLGAMLHYRASGGAEAWARDTALEGDWEDLLPEYAELDEAARRFEASLSPEALAALHEIGFTFDWDKE